jgi:heme exporter protein C
MYKYANPTIFMRLSAALLPWAIGATAIAFAVGLYLALLVAPPDYQQGETVRIMFIHVPAAWTALFVYSIMALASAIALIFRHPLADVAAKSAAPIGACFTFLALVTGSLWGKPMWGAWWVWDARLTSVLVLFLLYLGYIAVWQTMDDAHKAARIAAIVALVGFINVPIIKFSVEWWNSLHQPASVFRADGPAIHSSILTPLLVMGLAYSLLFLVLHLAAMRGEVLRRRVHALQLAQLEG